MFVQECSVTAWCEEIDRVGVVQLLERRALFRVRSGQQSHRVQARITVVAPLVMCEGGALLEERRDQANDAIDGPFQGVAPAAKHDGSQQHEGIGRRDRRDDRLLAVFDLAATGMLEPAIELALAEAELGVRDVEVLDFVVPAASQLLVEGRNEPGALSVPGRNRGQDDGLHDQSWRASFAPCLRRREEMV
jgi:hypothetical protein